MSVICAIRGKIKKGQIVDLLPYDNRYVDDIVQLRNQEKAKYFLSQDFDLSRRQQLLWMQSYLAREDEAGYVVVNKKGEVVGTVFLYNYQNDSIELGRVAFNLNKTMAAPYALECTVLILNLAFDLLQVREVIAHVKKDNYTLLRFLQKLGFRNKGECNIRNNVYFRLNISSCCKPYQQYNRYISAWADKNH